MKTSARMNYENVRFDRAGQAHAVISLIAPPASSGLQRPPLCIVPLLDVSPSMQGEKLLYAKRSLTKMIDHLSANDYCGLITFSSGSDILSAPKKCTPEFKEQLKKMVAEVRTTGSTNIAAALLDGLRVANDMDLAAEYITRVILFTDGAANVGPAVKPDEILALVDPNIGRATVSAFGYGVDAQQDFLLGLGKRGNGNYSFVQNPDDALTAFGKELGGLLSTYATDITIEVTPFSTHRVTKVVSDVEANEDDLGALILKIPDLLADETRNLVLEISLLQQKAPLPRSVNVFDVRVAYDILDATMHRKRQTVEAKVKLKFVKEGEEDKSPNSELDRIVSLAQLVRAQLEADEFAKKGNYVAAASIMQNCADSFSERGLGHLSAVASSVQSSVSSATNYVSTAGFRSSIARGGTRGIGGTYDAAASQMLQNAGVVLSSPSQNSTAASFTDDLTANPGASISGSVQGASASIDPNPSQGSVLPSNNIVSASNLGPAFDLQGLAATIWNADSADPDTDRKSSGTAPLSSEVVARLKAIRSKISQKKSDW